MTREINSRFVYGGQLPYIFNISNKQISVGIRAFAFAALHRYWAAKFRPICFFKLKSSSAFEIFFRQFFFVKLAFRNRFFIIETQEVMRELYFDLLYNLMQQLFISNRKLFSIARFRTFIWCSSSMF